MRSYRSVGAAAVALALVPLAIGRSGFLMRLAVLTLVFALFAIALNLAFGHTDQLFLFVGGLSGVGAYSTVLSANYVGLPALLTLPVGMVVCGAIAGLVSYVSARRNFSVIIIAILTLNLQLAFSELFVGASNITGGSTGLFYDGIVPAAAGEFVADTIGFQPSVALYYTLVLFVALALGVYVLLINSRYGMAFEAIREDEMAAKSAGVNVVRYKTFAGILAGSLIGLGGAMHTDLGLNVISPNLFTFLAVDTLVLIMLVLGGLRTTLGPVVGAVAVVAIEEALKLYTEFQTAIFGALLIILFLYFRSGIVPTAEDILARVRPGTTGGPLGDEEPDD